MFKNLKEANEIVAEFETLMGMCGVNEGCLANSMGSTYVIYYNENINWMFLQFIKSKGVVYAQTS